MATGVDGPDDIKLSDEESRKLAERKARRERRCAARSPRRAAEEAEGTIEAAGRSDVATDNPVPDAAVLG